MKYRDHFDHLGNPLETPWRIADLAVCAFLLGVVSALVSGALA